MSGSPHTFATTEAMDFHGTCGGGAAAMADGPIETRTWRQEVLALLLVLATGLAAAGVVALSLPAMMSLQKRLTPNPFAPLPIALLPAGPTLDDQQYLHGRTLFYSTCAACHGPRGLGVPGLGKDLTRSLFVCDNADAELAAFIRRGRAAEDPLNTTRVPMPPMGGNPNLTSADLVDLVVYLRGLQDPRRAPNVPEEVVAVKPPSEDDRTAALAAAGGDAELAEFIAHGATIFRASCAACHGKDARGMTGLGRDLIASEFVRSLDDEALLAFLLKGRDPSDPMNTTKVAMPPKGGNPALSEDDLLDVIEYMRALRKSAPQAPASGAG